MTGLDFESSDQSGSTKHFNGSVTTTSIKIPSVADKDISEFFIENLDSNDSNLLISLDNGTNFKTIKPGGWLSWTFKDVVRQFDIKSSNGSVSYECIVNFEVY